MRYYYANNAKTRRDYGTPARWTSNILVLCLDLFVICSSGPEGVPLEFIVQIFLFLINL